jgi:integrase
VTHALNLVRKCLGDARRAGHIDTNPAQGLRPQRKDPERERLYLTVEEIAAVAACEAIPLRARCCYRFAVYTGLRAGELWALRWGDVTLDGARPEVIVRRSHDRETTKSGRVRTVPLLPGAREALSDLRTLDDFSTEADDLVFPAVRGGQRLQNDDHGWSSRKVRGSARVGHREMAGVRRDVRFHDLRHTYASHLAMGTWTQRPLETAVVQRVMGHREIKTTLRYAHLAPNFVHDAMATPAADRAVGVMGVTGGEIGLRNAQSTTRATPRFPAPPTGIEPVTFGLGSRCSIH